MGQDPAAIRQEIEQTRERMGDTVDALGYKADVPARTKESISGKAQGVKAKITGAGSQVSEARRTPRMSGRPVSERSVSFRRTRWAW